MKKLFFILMSAVLLTGCVLFPTNNRETVSKAVQRKPAATEPKQEPPPAKLADKKDGIRVNIQTVRKENSQTVIAVTMDNHVYDISGMDVKNLSTLNGIKPLDYQIEETEMGGHHIKAKITFPGELTGRLIIGLKDDLQFNFDLP